MQTLNKRDRNLLIVMLIVVVGAAALLLAPSGKGAAAGGSKLPLEEAHRQNIKTRLQQKALEDDQKKLQPQVSRLTYNLPAEQLTTRMSEDLYRLADKAGVHIREIKPLRSRTLPDGSAARVPLQVRFRAPFQPNVMRFLYYTEDPANKMVVDKINISSTDTRAKSVDVDAQVTGFTRSLAGANGTDSGQGDSSDSTDTGSGS